MELLPRFELGTRFREDTPSRKPSDLPIESPFGRRMRSPVLPGNNKKLRVLEDSEKSGAATQIRTGDLILTKDALYRLSYSSI